MGIFSRDEKLSKIRKSVQSINKGRRVYIEAVSFLVCGIPPVTHLVYVIWVSCEGGGVGCGVGGNAGMGWHGVACPCLRPPSSSGGGRRQWPQKPGGRGKPQTGTAAALSLSLCPLNGQVKTSTTYLSHSICNPTFMYHVRHIPLAFHPLIAGVLPEKA